ncbi:SDR family NAD(P)-dependent oxidoreductase [Chitinasiproducens palmae]|uniref:NAD(P)-dependent dehydrogenase, short-chain alcohol dehydrogenase family n=1 Tax=Chitinasiproducens palmae TaxID=1770053 RepID=A0A1H2PPI6_9BURK|nr:SDR family oxidoreductase [Chitinasiproducens palmae]SDV48662.1 NAD(P)-dependent dehydrogenase, short-chain alcohol dehydrogenase family [Chitinasiproducens palmae]
MTAAMDLFRLDDKVVLITGAAQGIGLAAAKLCRQAGARVVLLDQNHEALQAIDFEASGEGGTWSRHVLDVTREDQVCEVFERAVVSHGRIDVLINNAGIALRDAAVDLSREAWERVMDVNVTGMFLCAREAARRMIGAGHGGAVVNTASIMGLSGGGVYPNISYQTSKGAVVNMTRALAVEWAPHAIRVNAVAPTYVDTQFVAALTRQPELMARIAAVTPLRRLATAQEVAAAMVFLASPAAAMTTGHILAVDGGFLAQ